MPLHSPLRPSSHLLSSITRPALSTLLVLFAFSPVLARAAVSQSVPSKPQINRKKKATPSVSNSKSAQKSAQGEEPFSVKIQHLESDLHTAQQSGDPEAIAAANKKLIAAELREKARIELLKGSYPAAADLYQQSLAFADVPSAHVDLGVAYLEIKQADNALEESRKAIFSDPQDPRAWRVQGSAFNMLHDYKQAAQALAHSLSIQGDGETAYSLATCFLTLREKEKARLVFQDMVDNFGDRGLLHVMFGRAYRDAGYTQDAVKEFRRALEVDPKTQHAHYFIGLLSLMESEWTPNAVARQEMAKEHELYPKDFLTNYLLGVFASNDKNYDQSNRYLITARDIDPSWPETWLYLGLNANDQGDKKLAEDDLRKAIELTGTEESRSHYQIRKAYYVLGRVLEQTGRKEEGQQILRKSRELQQRGLFESQQKLANISAESGGKLTGAVLPDAGLLKQDKESENFSGDNSAAAGSNVNHLELTAAQEKQLAEEDEQLSHMLGAAFNDLGTAEARQKSYEQALGNFKEAEKWQPETVGLMRNLGMAATRVGSYPDAVRGLSKAVETNPGDRVARAMLGVSYFMTDSFDNAAKTFAPLGEAVMADPGVAYPWAESLAKMGDFKQATEVLDHLQPQQLPADTLILIGQTWSEIGDYQRALSSYHRALEQKPTLFRAHYLAGLADIRAERPADAAVEFHAELELDPQNADAEYNLGYAYLQQSQREKAIETFAKVVADHPEHADAQYQLGKAKLEDGNVKDAVAHLETAAKFAPDKDYIHYQLQAAYRKDARLQDADRELAVYKEVKARNRAASSPAAQNQVRAKEKQNP